MNTTQQQSQAIKDQMRRYAVKQYVINLRKFRISLADTLANNPHNTWKGTVSEYGYDTDSRSAYKTYKAVKREWENVAILFNDAELEQLREIQ